MSLNFKMFRPIDKSERAGVMVGIKVLMALPLMAILAGGVVQAARPYIHVGRQGELISQPYATVEMMRTDEQGQLTEIGPYGSGLLGIYPYNSWLLDTGANSALAISDAASDLLSHGMINEGLYYEQGVAGYSELYISAAYQMLVTGTTGDVVTLPQTDNSVRIMNNELISVGGDAEIGGISGIIGMPAMIDRVTTLDFSSLIGITDFLELLVTPVDVKFPTSSAGTPLLPSGNGHRYSVSVDTRRLYLPEDGLPPGSPSDAPLPVWAPIPFMTAVAHAHDAQGNPTSVMGDFLFDTGAQMSLLTREMAFALGLDEDGDGSFQEEMITTMLVGGIGGTVEAELLLIDKIHLPTDQGTDLVWAPLDPEDGGLQVLVLPEGATPLPFSVFGFDFVAGGQILNLDSGDIFDATIEGTPYFEQVYLDFRTLETDGTGKIYFDLAAEVDRVVYEVGDANGDGWVNTADASILAANWQSTGAAWEDGDFNGDGIVNDLDGTLLAANWTPIFTPGDANGDGVVDDADAIILAANWQSSGAAWEDGDFNGDGIVDDADATLLAANWQYGVPIIPGDANGDGVVDDADAIILAANWLTTGAAWEDGDFNGDGIVNDLDATLLAANWQTTGSSAAVPEPGAAMLVALLGFWLIAARRQGGLAR